MPIGVPLGDPAVTFDHFVSFAGADAGVTLESALVAQGLASIGAVVGDDPAKFYETAHARLEPLFAQAADAPNAALELKSLAQHVASTADELHQATVKTHQPAADDGAQEVPMQAQDATPTYQDELARAEELAATPAPAAIAAANGFELPDGWNGRVEVTPVAVLNADGRPEFHVFAQGDLGTGPTWTVLASSEDAEQAYDLAEQLIVAHALTLDDEFDKAARLAKVDEDRVRRDPHSSDEDRSAAKEARKAAEASAFAAAADTQQRQAEQRDRDQASMTSQPAQHTTAAPGDERAGQAPARTALDVPYREKNQAKDLGAKWDRAAQTWYIPPGVDPAPFARWAPNAEKGAISAPLAAPLPNPQAPVDRGLQAVSGGSAAVSESRAAPTVATTAREYLAVPYVDRLAAKAAGALWDKAASSWYVGPKGDAATLAKWKPENTKVEQAPAMTPQEEFADALRAMGLVTTDPRSKEEHPLMDGKRHRIAAEGDKPGEKAGFYVGHLDGHPAGYIKNNRTGKDLRWKSKGYVLDPSEKAKLQAEAATKLAAREAEQTATHEKTAERLARQMGGFVPVAPLRNDTLPGGQGRQDACRRFH